MWMNLAIYVYELLIMLTVIVAGIMFFKLNNKKGVAFFLGITIPIFIIIFLLSFIFEKPEMKIINEISMEVNSGEKIEAPQTFYHFKNITKEVRIYDNVNYRKTGEYEIKFSVDTIHGIYSENTAVKIVDTKKPEIKLNGKEKYTLSYKKKYKEPGYKAYDEYEGNLTKKVKVYKEKINDNKYNLIYKVEDLAGNTDVKIREINIKDKTAPEIILKGASNVLVFLGDEYKEKGVIAKDEKDGDLTDKVETIGEVDTSKEGAYTIIYKVSDSSGNTSQTNRIVVVRKKTKTLAKKNKNGKVGIIYLTFDDGPSSNITPKILKILKKKNVKATFFVLNYDSVGEKIIKKEYKEGHTIGIHGYSHDYSTIYKSEKTYLKNITKLQKKIRGSTGYNATITRFPGGSSNTISDYNPGIMTRLSKLLPKKGYKYFDWNVSSEDAEGKKTAKTLYKNVINGLDKNGRNVVLMHDFASNKAILKALPKIIDYCKKKGYVFERITEDTPMITHRVLN